MQREGRSNLLLHDSRALVNRFRTGDQLSQRGGNAVRWRRGCRASLGVRPGSRFDLRQSGLGSPDFAQDFVCGSSPDKRLGVFVPALQIRGKRGDQLIDTGDGQSLELTPSDFVEEQLDQVEPGGGCRHEVKVDPRVLFKPRLHLRMLVRGVVVEDEVRSSFRSVAFSTFFRKRKNS